MLNFKVFNGLSIFLIVVSSMVTALPGGVTKLALLALIFLNILAFGISKLRLLSILLICICVLANVLKVGITDFEPSIVVFAILVIWFLSLPMNEQYFNDILRPAIITMFFFGIIASMVTVVLGVGSFATSMLPKGLPYIYAFRGTTSTPQTFGTLGIIVYLCYSVGLLGQTRSRLRRWGVVFLANLSLNRVTFVESVLLFFRKRIAVFVLLVFCLSLFALAYSDNVLFTVSTLQSRMDLTAGIWSQYIQGSDYEVAFGSFKQPDVFFSTSYVDINYIENGYMFLLYYFGILGAFVYVATALALLVGVPLIHKLSVDKGVFYVALVYFLLVPLLTHEFLSITFYLMLYVVTLVYKAKKEQAAQLTPNLRVQ